MTNLDPEQVAAFDQITAHFDPRIIAMIETVQTFLRAGLPVEDVFSSTSRAVFEGMKDPEVIATFAGLTIVRMAEILNEAKDAGDDDE